MTSRAPTLLLVVFAALVLSACSAAAGSQEASSGAGGTIEMAISATCTEGSDSQCVSVNGERVVLPTTFEQVGIEDSSVAGDGQNAVDVTFDKNGTEVFRTLTQQAAGAGDETRLVLRIGGEMLAAVVVMEALESDQIQIALSPDDSPQEIVRLIQGS